MSLRVATATTLLSGTAFVFQLIAVLSIPITQTIIMCSYGEYSFGLFGYCKYNDCSFPAQIGYDISILNQQASGFYLLPKSRKVLSKLLIIHPIAAALTLIVLIFFVFSYFIEFCRIHNTSVFFILWVFITCLLTLFSFLVDILLFVPHLGWGGWIVLAAAVINISNWITLCFMRRKALQRVSTGITKRIRNALESKISLHAFNIDENLILISPNSLQPLIRISSNMGSTIDLRAFDKRADESGGLLKVIYPDKHKLVNTEYMTSVTETISNNSRLFTGLTIANSSRETHTLGMKWSEISSATNSLLRVDSQKYLSKKTTSQQRKKNNIPYPTLTDMEEQRFTLPSDFRIYRALNQMPISPAYGRAKNYVMPMGTTLIKLNYEITEVDRLAATCLKMAVSKESSNGVLLNYETSTSSEVDDSGASRQRNGQASAINNSLLLRKPIESEAPVILRPTSSTVFDLSLKDKNYQNSCMVDNHVLLESLEVSPTLPLTPHKTGFHLSKSNLLNQAESETNTHKLIAIRERWDRSDMVNPNPSHDN